jgi:hypothetical protein
MPIIKIRQRCINSNGNETTIVSTNLCLETINVLYDYIYCPVKNYMYKSNRNAGNPDHILNALNLIEDITIYNDLRFCLENKDDNNEKYNIETIIQKYNKRTQNNDANIDTICRHLIKYFNDTDKLRTGSVNSNKIYFIDL